MATDDAGHHRMAYAPGLDGLRGLAVLAVLVFHAGPSSWLPGGFLGVSVFFTLSGYLITSLILGEVDAHGRLDLGRFWVRRVRRLLPALLVTAAAVVVMAHAMDLPARTRGELLGGLTYTSNWVQLASGSTYAELFQAPSPLTHLWSLAIEEQFYLVFPLVAWLVVRRQPASGTAGDRLARTLGVVGVVTVISGLAWTRMVHDADIAYYATPARAPEIAAGVVLAVIVRRWRMRSADQDLRPAPVAITVAGLAGLVALLVLMRRTQVTDGWVGNGGLALFALVSLALVTAAGRDGPVASALGVAPLRWLGRISYGLYLYHWLVVVVLSSPRVTLAPVPLFALRVAVSLGLATASFALIEQPVRHGHAHTGARRPVPAQLGATLVVLAVAAGLAWLATPEAPAPPPRAAAPAVVASVPPTAPGTTTDVGSVDRPPSVALFGDSVPNWLVRDGGSALDPADVTLVDGTSEGCDGAEGAPVGRAGTGVVVTVPASCTGWRTQYPPVFAGGRADLATLMVGSGAVLDRELDGEFRGPCDDVAQRWYAADVAARLRWLQDHADRVVVVLPAWAEEWSGWVNPPDHHARTDCVRATLQAEATQASTPSSPVEVVDLADLLCPTGPDACRPFRQTDGVHVDPDHAPRVLRWVVARAEEAAGARPSP